METEYLLPCSKNPSCCL